MKRIRTLFLNMSLMAFTGTLFSGCQTINETMEDGKLLTGIVALYVGVAAIVMIIVYITHMGACRTYEKQEA